MKLEKVDLFSTTKEVILTFCLLGVLFFTHVGFKYFKYQEFLKSNAFYKGQVILVYEKINKKNRPYTIAQIKTKDFILYSKIAKKYHLNKNDFISFKSYKKRVKFLDFLKRSFYAPTYKIKLLHQKQNSLKDDLQNFIAKQHMFNEPKELYSALFLATPISKDLRKKIQNWGISHLVAISGFHLGVIYASLFFVFKIFYGYFHERFFPYKNINFHLGVVIFLFLAYYTYLLDFSPSFLRSFTMGIIGFYFYMRHIKLVSFANLALSGAILIVLFPSLILSISFCFSMMGVFYIFLYLHHFRFKKFDFLFINAWVYFGMLIPVHFWFSYISYQQIMSILISIGFSVFYPLSLLLHLFGFGGIFDGALMWFLNINFGGEFVKTPLWLFIFYVFLSLVSIKSKLLSCLSIFLGVLYLLFI